MTTIAIAGISRPLGQRLLALLDRDDSVDRVLGLDLALPSESSTKLEFHETDLLDPRLPKMLAGCDALVHFPLGSPLRGAARLAPAEGATALVDAVASAPVARLVMCSTAVVYGAHPDNPVPIGEDAPLRPNADYDDAIRVHAAERVVDAFRSAAETGVVVLRPAPVVGPHADGFVARLLEAPRFPTIRGYAPPLQVVHEDDVASALAAACSGRIPPGVYNVAPEGAMDRDEVLALAGRRPIELPEAVAFSLADRARRLGLSDAPPGELRFLMHPLVVDAGRLAAAGWRPAFSNREALVAAVEARRQWVWLGRGRLRKADLATGAAATVGLIGAIAAVRRARRRSS